MISSGLNRSSAPLASRLRTPAESPLQTFKNKNSTQKALATFENQKTKPQQNHKVKSIRLSDPEIFRLNPQGNKTKVGAQGAVNAYQDIEQLIQTEKLSSLLGIDIKI